MVPKWEEKRGYDLDLLLLSLWNGADGEERSPPESATALGMGMEGWIWRDRRKGKIYRQPADFPGRSGLWLSLVIDKINTPIQTEYTLTGPVLTMYPRVTSILQQSSCLSLLLMDLRICSTTSGYSVFVNESFSFQTPKDKEVCYISSSQ